MEFGRRVAIERDLEKSDAFKYSNVGKLIAFQSLETNKCLYSDDGTSTWKLQRNWNLQLLLLLVLLSIVLSTTKSILSS